MINFNKIFHIEKALLENGITVNFIGMTTNGSYGFKEDLKKRVLYVWTGKGDDYMTKISSKGDKRLKIIDVKIYRAIK